VHRGQFHDVVISDGVVRRYPRDERSRRQLGDRVSILRALARLDLPVAVPNVITPPDLEQPLGRCHVTLSLVPGEPLESRDIETGDIERSVAAQLARLLTHMRVAGETLAHHTAFPRADSHRWRRFADDVADVLFPLMSFDGRRRAETELAQVIGLDGAGNALVHGDLGTPNLLWDKPGPLLSGVIDWDDAHLGSQADDLASLGVSFGWPLAARIDSLLHGNQPLIAAARLIAGTFALQQALPAALTGDVDNLKVGLDAYVN
jgi:aminoglycoside phosphotransferase (APT) family kinase protein